MQLRVQIPEPLSRMCQETSEGRSWKDLAQSHFDENCVRWHFIAEGFLPAQYGVVAFGRQHSTAAIMKLMPPGPEAEAEAAALSAYRGHGAVELLEWNPASAALLVARAEPGFSLRESRLSDDEMTQVLGLVMTTLWRAPVERFKDGPRMRDYLVERPEIMRGRWRHTKNPVTKALLDRSVRIFQDWPKSGPLVLLHNDLHHDNVVKSDDSWLAIDPSSNLGYAEADIAPMLRNPWKQVRGTDALRPRNRRRLAILSDVTSIDVDLARDYAIANTVDLALWSASEDASDDAEYFCEVANSLCDEVK